MLTGVENALVDADLPVTAYGAISALSTTEPTPPPPTPRQASPILNVIWMTSRLWYKEGAEQQHRVFDSTFRVLKWIFPSLPGESRDSVLVNKLLAGEVDW